METENPIRKRTSPGAKPSAVPRIQSPTARAAYEKKRLIEYNERLVSRTENRISKTYLHDLEGRGLLGGEVEGSANVINTNLKLQYETQTLLDV